jgi:mannose-6-phosphate isomerase-like protein (cupin superfamily)
MEPIVLNRIYRGQPHKIPKGWGHELVVCNYIGNELITEKGYCLKFLVFDDKNVGSMHFHPIKHETFYILKGNFKLFYINPANADELSMDLTEGDVVVIPPFNSHRITCGTGGGTIIEASSPDRPEDSYRVAKGDSQK